MLEDRNLEPRPSKYGGDGDERLGNHLLILLLFTGIASFLNTVTGKPESGEHGSAQHIETAERDAAGQPCCDRHDLAHQQKDQPRHEQTYPAHRPI